MTTTWNKVAKASGTSYTKVSKPSPNVPGAIIPGTPIGLLLALTYTTNFTQSLWNKVAKASGTTWTDVPKAT